MVMLVCLINYQLISRCGQYQGHLANAGIRVRIDNINYRHEGLFVNREVYHCYVVMAE